MTETGPFDADIEFSNGAQTVRLGGYLRDRETLNAAAEVVTDRTVHSLPPTVDLRSHCTQVEDQKRLASCTANAAVGALEYHRKKQNLDPSDLSRLFVYYNTRKMRAATDRDTGAQMEECMAALLVYGAPRAELWPYDDRERWKMEPPREAYEDAKTNEALQYARVARGAGVLSTVAAGYPVTFGCFLPKIAYDIAGRTGVMPELTEMMWQSPGLGGHAMLFVGYDLVRKTYLVRNSWGARWGDDGYCTIPFDVIDRATPPESIWVVGRLEQEGGITLRAPDTATKADKFRQEVRADLGGDLAKVRAGLRDRLMRG